MNIYSMLFNTLCIYFMVTTAPAAKASPQTKAYIAAFFLIVFLGNATLLDYRLIEAGLRALSIAAVFVVLYWVLIRSVKPKS